MTNSVTISAQTAEGKTLDVLGELIAKRQQWMRETTAQAVIATAINILSSLRTLTKVCDPKKAAGFVSVAPYPALVVSFRRVGAKCFPCLRPPGKPTKEDPKPHAKVSFVNAAGKPCKGWLNTVKVFIAQDRRSGDLKGNVKRYYIIARNLAEARAAAGSRRIKRIERFSGMAKWVIGVAQAKISDGGGGFNQTPSVAAQRVGNSALTVSVDQVGFSQGTVSVSVNDALKYAQLALQNGPSDFQLALQKAANRTVGILNHSAERAVFSFDQIPTPFPEVANRKAT